VLGLASRAVSDSGSLANREHRRPSKKQAAATQAEPQATRIAEGEYELYEEGSGGAVGPFGEEVYEFRETWTLSRATGGNFEVKGERRFRPGKDKDVVTRPFAVELSRDLTVLRLTEFSKLKWIQDSGPLTCEFLSAEMRCSAGVKKPNVSNDWHIEVQHPYGLLWPISPFSLGSVAHESERDPQITTRASLVTIEQPSAENPVSPMVLSGELHYLGVESLQAAGRPWEAYKFSIKVPLHPKFVIWASKKGMLLALAVEHEHGNWPKEGLRLVRYETFADF